MKIAAAQSKIKEKTFLKYIRTARLWGYDSTIFTVMKEEYIIDALYSSYLSKATLEVEGQILAADNILSWVSNKDNSNQL